MAHLWFILASQEHSNNRRKARHPSTEPHCASLALTFCLRRPNDPPFITEPGKGCPTISSASKADSIIFSRLMPVSMLISSHIKTRSSVHTLPEAPECEANGQPPKPATAASNVLTPICNPAKALAIPIPRVS